MNEIFKYIKILGYRINSESDCLCVSEVCAHIRNTDKPKWLACFNPHSYTMAKKNLIFSAALKNADWLVPDGIGIVIAARLLLGVNLTRVTGSDVFYGVMQYLEYSKRTVFLLGGQSATLVDMSNRIKIDYPNVKIVGLYSPPFQDEFDSVEIEKMVQCVNRSRPDVLWVGMTSPKQDLFIYSNLNRLDVKFAAGIGAVFDFYAGRIKRAPRVVRYAGLEWLTRLIKNPLKMWRRTVVSAPIFILDVFVERIARKRNH
jgi:N-acetylglucosaminyldiphosphoundecaprenol N-acetyl-beta-D-mannosaminyltransferase